MYLYSVLKILFCLVTLVVAYPDDVGLSDGYLSYTTPDFDFKLVKSSQTLASISPKLNSAFDFSPFDFLYRRAANGNHYFGDLFLRYRATGQADWIDLDTAAKRAPVQVLNGTSGVVATSNLAPTIGNNTSLRITREWGIDGGDITLSFTVQNKDKGSIEIGGFGFAVDINNVFTNRTVDDVNTKCSLMEQNIGLSGGYIQVVPVSGSGPALVIAPLGNTRFEGWRHIMEDENTDLNYDSTTYEGGFSWETLTKGYFEREWNATVPWNVPTSKVLASGEKLTYGLRFSVAKDMRDIENVVRAKGVPLAVGLPGYIIEQNADSSLYLYHNSAVSSITTFPEGAITFKASQPYVYTLTASSAAWGRVRATILYEDGAEHTVQYYITKSNVLAVNDLGNFLTTEQWFTDTTDPFKRAPSVMGYDRSVNRIVTQDVSVWIAGLEDEAGAGAWLAAAMKQVAQPVPDQVAKLEDFVHQTVVGNLEMPGIAAVHGSLFYYQPDQVDYPYNPNLDWTQWYSWDKVRANITYRSYNYVHVSALYWSLYRTARYYPELVTQASWDWYLLKAYDTVMWCLSKQEWNQYYKTDYRLDGLMGETVWSELLFDLERENYTTQAANIKGFMKERADHWVAQTYPFQSELDWDSTGQEGVYLWTTYFGYTEIATRTISSILGYMFTISHWGYNGNARRYWDFGYAGKFGFIERQLHHYGASLNALPLSLHYQANPTDIYALRIAYGGTSGALTNIDQEGFASCAFHSFPQYLEWDAYSGDYGPGFSGYVLGSTAYVVETEEFGIQAFGGVVSISGYKGSEMVLVRPTDGVRKRVYIAVLGLKIVLGAGVIESVEYEKGGGKTVKVKIAGKIEGVDSMANTTMAIVRLENSAGLTGVGEPVVTAGAEQGRGGWIVNLKSGSAEITIGFQ